MRILMWAKTMAQKASVKLAVWTGAFAEVQQEAVGLAQTAIGLASRNDALQEALAGMNERRRAEVGSLNNIVAALVTQQGLAAAEVPADLIETTRDRVVEIDFDRDRRVVTLLITDGDDEAPGEGEGGEADLLGGCDAHCGCAKNG